MLAKGFDMKTLISMINVKAKDKHSVYIYIRFQCSSQITASSLMTSEEREVRLGVRKLMFTVRYHTRLLKCLSSPAVFITVMVEDRRLQSINFNPVICLGFLRQGSTMTARLPCNLLASSASPAACSSPASAPKC